MGVSQGRLDKILNMSYRVRTRENYRSWKQWNKGGPY